LPALSAASADPLARPGTGPSLYAISSSLREIARADRQDSRGLDVQRRWAAAERGEVAKMPGELVEDQRQPNTTTMRSAPP
jgi:hypothetical protein